MSKFENLNMDTGLVDYDQFNFEGDTIVFTGYEDNGKCAICGYYSHYYSLSFHTYTCSEECNRRLWNDYFEALKGK